MDVARSRQAVALIGLAPLELDPANGLLAICKAPADALAQLRELPAGRDEGGQPRRPLRLAVWGAGAHDTAGEPTTATPVDYQRAGNALLAWLRDVGADETWVLTDEQDQQWPARLQALGFTEAPFAGEREAAHCRRFCFAIRSYKPAPDWLGPRNWANPELFGLFRW